MRFWLEFETAPRATKKDKRGGERRKRTGRSANRRHPIFTSPISFIGKKPAHLPPRASKGEAGVDWWRYSPREAAQHTHPIHHGLPWNSLEIVTCEDCAQRRGHDKVSHQPDAASRVRELQLWSPVRPSVGLPAHRHRLAAMEPQAGVDGSEWTARWDGRSGRGRYAGFPARRWSRPACRYVRRTCISSSMDKF